MVELMIIDLDNTKRAVDVTPLGVDGIGLYDAVIAEYPMPDIVLESYEKFVQRVSQAPKTRSPRKRTPTSSPHGRKSTSEV